MTAVMTSNYYPKMITRGFGYAKEVKDLAGGRGWKDTKEDLKNNELGINIGLKYPKNSNKALYNHIFDNYIVPQRKK